MGDGDVMEASWSEARPGSSLIYARSFVDGAWRERAPGAASAMGVAGETDVRDPVSLIGDRPYVFWRAYSACLMARVWDGASWAEVTRGATA